VALVDPFNIQIENCLGSRDGRDRFRELFVSIDDNQRNNILTTGNSQFSMSSLHSKVTGVAGVWRSGSDPVLGINSVWNGGGDNETQLEIVVRVEAL